MNVIQTAIEALELFQEFAKSLGCVPEARIGEAIVALRAAQEGDLPEPVGILQEEAFGRGVVLWIKKPIDGTNLYTADQLRTAIAAAGGGVPQAWISLEEQRPEPEVFVLAWDGKKVTVDWWGSLYRPHGTEYTHWMPFPTPPGVSGRSMYGMHSLASSPQPEAAPAVAQVPMNYDQMRNFIETHADYNIAGWRVWGMDKLMDFIGKVERAHGIAAAPEAPAQAAPET